MSQYEGRKGPIGENIRDILPGSRMPAADSTLVFFCVEAICERRAGTSLKNFTYSNTIEFTALG